MRRFGKGLKKMARGINVLLTLVDKFSAPITAVTTKTGKAERQFKNTQNAVNNFAKGANNKFLGLVGTVGKLGAIAGTLGGVLTIGGIVAASQKWLELAKDQVEAETKLEAVLKNVASIQAMGGDYYKQVKNDLVGYAGELQKVGVVGDEVTLSGMQQLATFQLNGEQIKTLSGGMLDLLVQQKGMNATQQDAVGIANMIGKAMTGQVTAMSRVGITMTEAEQEIIKNGDAMTKAATIAKVLQNNVGGVNAALAKTDEGKAKQAMNAYGDMLENFGKKLSPIKSKLWGAFGKLLPVIESKAMVVFDLISKKFDQLAPLIDKYLPQIIDGFVQLIDFAFRTFSILGDVMGFLLDNSNVLLPVLGGLVAGFTAFNLAVQGAAVLKTVIGFMQGVSAAGGMMNFVLSLSRIAFASLGIGLVVAILILLYQRSEKVRVIMQAVYERLKVFGSYIAEVLKPLFETAFSVIETVVTGAFMQVMTVVNTIQTVFTNLIDFIVNVFTGNWSGAWQNVINIFGSLFDGLVQLVRTPLNLIIDMVNKVISSINGINITIPSWVPGFGGKGFKPDLPTVPNFATGTSYFKGGLAEINEDGRGEIVNLPSGSQIVPHDKSAGQMNLQPQIALYLTIQGNVIGNEEYADYVGDVIVAKLRAALGNI